MFRNIGTLILAASFALAACAHKEEKKDELPTQETATPQPQPEAQPAPPPTPPTCTQTQVLDGMTCLDVATALNGLRAEIPCKPGHKPEECAAAVARPSKSITLGGKAGQLYDVTVRVSGVVELNSFPGGQTQDYWTVGGKPGDKKAGVFQLDVSQPAQTFFLNTGNVGKRTWAAQYTRTIRADGGATITLVGDSQDSKLVANRDLKNNPQIVADVPPAPGPFDGQFVQIDVLSVTAAQ